MEGENALEFQYPKKSLMIMGSESHGVSSEISEKCTKISIPKIGQAESLNVAMATGVICAAYSKNAN
jgi:TrmH family RNA methyltransferase